MKRILIAAIFLALAGGTVRGQDKFQTRKDVVYAVHDGVSLTGDLYLPMSAGRHPAMMFIHGGGFRAGSKAAYGSSWGPYLAERGYVVFSIDYRLAKANEPAWPQALLDCKAAVQYLRGNSAMLGVDPERIGVGGDSAGGELSAMLAVTQDWIVFGNKYPMDTYADVRTHVKVAMPIYGVYDMMAWERYTATRSNNNTGSLDLLFGGPPDQKPGPYFEASPINYVRVAAKNLGALAIQNAATSTPWFVSWGMVDAVVPPEGQSIPFVQALKDAGAEVTAVPVPGVDHFWFTSSAFTGKKGVPKCEEATPAKFACSGATPNDYIAAQLLDFLAHNL